MFFDCPDFLCAQKILGACQIASASKNAGNIIGIANDIVDLYQATIGFNDMSLPDGGLFDIGPPKGVFWFSPHGLHRDGNSVDIDHCALSAVSNNQNSQGACPVGWVNIPKPKLLKLCLKYNGTLIIEGPIHCEF